MSSDAKQLLDRMLNKKLYVIIWHGIEGVNISTTLREHLEFMIALEKRGILFASGPLSGIPGDGLTILRAVSIDEARAIAEEDPFVIKGLRTFDLREWTMMEGLIGLTTIDDIRTVIPHPYYGPASWLGMGPVIE